MTDGHFRTYTALLEKTDWSKYGVAAAAMLTAGESQIVKMVAINKRGNILPPCGRCREFIIQLMIKISRLKFSLIETKPLS